MAYTQRHHKQYSHTELTLSKAMKDIPALNFYSSLLLLLLLRIVV